MNIKSLAIAMIFVATTAFLPSRASAVTPADLREVQGFVLTSDFVTRYAGILKDSEAMVETTRDVVEGSNPTLASMTAVIEQASGSAAVLARHGMTARQLLVGSMALTTTMAYEMMSAADPRYAAKVASANRPSAANIAFCRSHHAEVDKVFGLSR